MDLPVYTIVWASIFGFCFFLGFLSWLCGWEYCRPTVSVGFGVGVHVGDGGGGGGDGGF